LKIIPVKMIAELINIWYKKNNVLFTGAMLSKSTGISSSAMYETYILISIANPTKGI